MAREVVLPPVDATPEQIAMVLVLAPAGKIRDRDREPDLDSATPGAEADRLSRNNDP